MATWTIDAVSVDKLLLNLNDQTIRNSAGLALDGEFVTGSGATQSGDDTQGGPFHFRINVLAGDVDGNGQVDADEVVGIGAAFLKTPNDAGWDPFADLDTSAQVDASDVVPIGTYFLNALPNDEPPEVTFPAARLALLNIQGRPTFLTQNVTSTRNTRSNTVDLDAALQTISNDARWIVFAEPDTSDQVNSVAVPPIDADVLNAPHTDQSPDVAWRAPLTAPVGAPRWHRFSHPNDLD